MSVSLNLTHSYQRNSLPMEREELAACTIQPSVGVYKTISSKCCFVQHKDATVYKIQLMNLTCLDEDGVLVNVVPTKELVLYIVSYACRVLEFMYMYKYVHHSAVWPW